MNASWSVLQTPDHFQASARTGFSLGWAGCVSLLGNRLGVSRLAIGCRGGIRTRGLLIMSQMIYR